MRLSLWRSYRWGLALGFYPRDLWVGAYWHTEPEYFLRGQRRLTTLFLCLLPCLPLVLTWRWGEVRDPDRRHGVASYR